MDTNYTWFCLLSINKSTNITENFLQKIKNDLPLLQDSIKNKFGINLFGLVHDTKNLNESFPNYDDYKKLLYEISSFLLDNFPKETFKMFTSRFDGENISMITIRNGMWKESFCVMSTKLKISSEKNIFEMNEEIKINYYPTLYTFDVPYNITKFINPDYVFEFNQY
jgi:hypothetical protein